MLSFAALVPHPLVSLPEIGSNTKDIIPRTKKAFKKLAQELYATQPDIIVVVSEHSNAVPGAFTINQSPKLVIDFSKYGDLVDRAEFTNELGFGYRVKESVEASLPVSLIADEKLDYRAGVPLYHLTENLNTKNLRIVSIGVAELPLKDHEAFGKALKKHIGIRTERIAVIVSGNLAHLPADTGDIEGADEFNQKIRKIVSTRESMTIKKLEKLDDYSHLHESITRPAATLFAILGDMQITPHEIAFEHELGVGYLTVQYELAG